MKRFVLITIIASLIWSTYATAAYAAAAESGTSSPKKIMFYLKPDISVELNGARLIFKNINGENVYPIIYNGTAYLSLRAVSAIMNEPIEWDSGSKTVYIGKTLSYPVKTSAPIPTNAAITANSTQIAEINKIVPSLVTGYSKSDIFIMYDFVLQTFKDSTGTTIYPINYEGTTYLPVRAISNLLNEPIHWDATAKKISIGVTAEEKPVDPSKEENDPTEETPTEQIDKTAVLFKDIFEREEALYYEASAKITNIRSATEEEKQAIAASASDNYLNAQSITTEVKSVKVKSLTDEEKAAHEKLLAFAESNEYYLLILENIAYLAASDSDYSMLADTFLYFAMDAQTKMEAARKLIIID